jgi:signal transduction histidine kinase
MSAVTTASQANKDLNTKRSIIKWWLEPRSKDRDEAFRERSIRIATALVVILVLISFILTVVVFKNKWDIISLPTLHIFLLAGFLLSAYLVSRELIITAAWIIVITALIAAAGILILNRTDYANLVNGIPLYIVVVLLAALVLPRNAIWVISAVAVLTYGIAMTISQASVSDQPGYNISQAILVALIVVPTVGAILHRLRVEFDARLEAMHESIQQAELAQQRAEDSRRQAEKSRQRAEEADKAKSQFLANMSHELRTPLNAIIGYDEAMLGGMVGEFTPQQIKLLGHMQHNSRRLLGLINDILDLSKVESGSLQVFLAPMSPQKVIQETVESLRSLADEKKVSLEVQFSNAVPEVVLGDAKKLQQVLVNIVSNAVKFTDKGGVTVDVGVVDANHWQFSVKDTGIGMPPNAASYIFEPFQQVDGTDKRKYKGTGLGLAITKRLVERLGGSIEMASELGKGSTFTIAFPRAYVPGDNVKLENV